MLMILFAVNKILTFIYFFYFLILDCCDGSDEWNSGVECPNLCQIQGEKWRQEVEQNRIVQKSGFEKRNNLNQIGIKQLEEKKIELEKIKIEHDELQQLKVSIETKKNVAEAREHEAKEKYDSVWNGLLIVLNLIRNFKNFSFET